MKDNETNSHNTSKIESEIRPEISDDVVMEEITINPPIRDSLEVEVLIKTKEDLQHDI